MPENAGAVPEHAPETMAPPASVIEVTHSSYMLNMPRIVGVIVVAALTAVVMIILVAELSPPAIQEAVRYVLLVVMGALIWTSVMQRQKSDRRKLRTLMEKSKAEPTATRVKVALSITHGMWPQSTMRELTKVLGEQGALDATVRISPSDQPTTIEPISVPFEPHRPDELSELLVSTEQDADQRTTEPRKAPPRGIRRNVILKGGWLLVVLFGVAWSIHAIVAIKSRSVTPSFMVWTLVLLTFILLPVGSSWIGGSQWLAVPGGLVVRKSAWLKRGWTSHLFYRSKAVVVLYRLYRRQWILIAADGEACESTIGTRAELECALAAWLSPVPPPTRAELADWL